ncbi:hypothetical protein H1R20_g6762, partial [Candolleomyces eurysporus]
MLSFAQLFIIWSATPCRTDGGRGDRCQGGRRYDRESLHLVSDVGRCRSWQVAVFGFDFGVGIYISAAFYYNNPLFTATIHDGSSFTL